MSHPVLLQQQVHTMNTNTCKLIIVTSCYISYIT